MSKPEENFWEYKSLQEMDTHEWESLCDGCGKCCLIKLKQAGEEEIFYTSVVCRLFDPGKCRCRDYRHRQSRVSDCLVLHVSNIPEFDWLPTTCAYRMLARSEALAWWHPLVSGRQETVHEAGISVLGRVVSEDAVHPDSVDDFIIDWETGDTANK
ncbi:MAG: YcgN family cysteine cluster protein [Gammaproteobacteria bacterium]|nr:MAG: YcgN family cysteine cluster protein [Gammaproteobacteria bacterium]